MNSALICVGRLKERYWREAAAEYEKRLTRFGRFETIELPDLPEPANSSPAIERQICQREGEAILAKIPARDPSPCAPQRKRRTRNPAAVHCLLSAVLSAVC